MTKPPTPRRQTLQALMSLGVAVPLGLAAPRSSRALMAGDPPDSAQLRVLPNTADSPWSGVGAVLIGDSVYTGTLLDRRHVLTAAHVVAGRSPAAVRFQIDAGAGPAIHAARRITVHERYRGFSPPPYPAWDVAIIRLDEAVPAMVATYTPYFGSLRLQTVITLIGCGMSGSGREGPTIPARADVRRIGQNVIDQFVPLPDAPGTPGFFVYDFDGPPQPGPPGPRSFNAMGGGSLGNRIETIVATGDSGAPAFIVRGRYRALIGVSTFTASTLLGGSDPSRSGLSRFGAIGGGILLAPLEGWIESTIG